MLQLTLRNAEVAIAGKVVQAVTDEPMAGAAVEIVQMPDKFVRILQLKQMQYGTRWQGLQQRLDRKISDVDGGFFFTDLPIGDYTLRATIPNSGRRYQKIEKIYQVRHKFNSSELATQMGDLAIPPTGIEGRIYAQDKTIPFAKVLLVGTTEATFANQEGRYRFTGLEASSHAGQQIFFQISSPDHGSQQRSAVLSQGVMSNIDFSLD